MKIRWLLIFIVCALAGTLSLRIGLQRMSLSGSIGGHTTAVKQPLPAYVRALRPNYPYSIIPGGAYNGAELRYADEEDPVVKAHYAGFNLRRAHVVQLTEDTYQYASYRKQNQVYWTKKKLRIQRGELLLTDGKNYARARCGNRLSDQPHTPVSAQEPSVAALMTPAMRLGTPMALAKRPPLGELSSILPADGGRLRPVWPAGGALPPEMPPFFPVSPGAPVMMPPIFPAGGTSVTPFTPPASPPGSPPGTPTGPPVGPPIIPVSPPEVSTVPEPQALYLFLITFVLSLYALTRMVPAQEEKREAEKKDGGAKQS